MRGIVSEILATINLILSLRHIEYEAKIYFVVRSQKEIVTV